VSRNDRALRKAYGYEDIRALARRRLPKVVFDFIEGGAGAEQTMRANVLAFEQVTLRPHQGCAPPTTDLSTSVLGETVRMPVLVSCCGAALFIHPDGERGIARAAARAGTVYIVPHLGGTRSEEVRQASTGPLWYQIYHYGGRKVAEPAVQRAWEAGYRTLVVNVDNGRTLRERDARNGMAALVGTNPLSALPYLCKLLAHPAWLMRFLRTPHPTLAPNAVLPDGRLMNASDIVQASTQPDSSFRWSDFQWLRELWPGTIIPKGILTAEDARRAVDCGAKGLIVSNHGGKTIDGLGATLRALPEVVAAVPSDIPVLIDGGIRRGTDVIKALCLGARAVLIGRAYMFGLTCGEAGVSRMLALLEDDLHKSLKTLGCGSIAELGPEFICVPADWCPAAGLPAPR
jgi:isopentenyl diphosphate isomerase/L-lactate dehydrogenase-like FMN-dependent dehydrogenase